MSTQASPRPLDDVEVLTRRLRRAESKVAHLESMIEDSTRSLYFTQEELRRSSDFITKVLHAMQSAVLVTDTECRVVVVGGTAERLLGRDKRELLDVPLYEFVPGVDACPTFDRERETERELEFVRPDGATVPVLMTSSPIFDEDGRPIAIVNVATDLTERRRREAERRQSQKLESIGQLAAGVAHEINTPVQFIGDSTRFLGEVVDDLLQLVELCLGPPRTASSDPIADEELQAQIAELVETIDLEFVRDEAPRAVERTEGGVRRVSEIVAALKQFAHPGSGAATRCDLGEIIRTALVVASNEYRYHADVVTELDPVPPVLADPGDLGQVVLNLLVNAAHAIADRGDGVRGTITMRVRADSSHVVVEVEDTGTGIAPDVMERIFDPFFTTKEVGRGTGQGLAIVVSLVERHHGRVEVDSTVGCGTTFRLLFPLGDRG